jgi:polygalacturonase
VASAEHSILDYGGIPSATDNDSCWTNSAALTAAILAANSSSSDRVALVPAGYSFYIFEVEASYLQDVTIRIDGDLLVSNNITAWPTENSRHTMAALYIGDSEGITLEGSGTFDGQGYDWWWTVLLTAVVGGTPARAAL